VLSSKQTFSLGSKLGSVLGFVVGVIVELLGIEEGIRDR
jgi:hypothetical protein